MISARQTLNILNESLASNNGFIDPIFSMSITPNNYTDNAVPALVTISAAITLNDAISVAWVLKQGVLFIDSDTTTTINRTYTAPSANTIYTLTVDYTGGLTSKSTQANVVVEKPAYFGQLHNPSDDIVIAADLIPFLPILTYSVQSVVANLITLVLTHTGRIVFVSPYSYGTVFDIVDEMDLSVINEFNIIDDTVNSRFIYTKINTVIPGTYKYKLQY